MDSSKIALIALINNFAAIGHGVLGLSEQNLHTLQPGQLDAHAPIAVIGVGTGLGQGFLIRHPSRDAEGYQVLARLKGDMQTLPLGFF